MSVGECVPIFDKDGNPTVLHYGRWFCYKCSMERIFIPYPRTGVLKTCCPNCGSSMVFRPE